MRSWRFAARLSFAGDTYSASEKSFSQAVGWSFFLRLAGAFFGAGDRLWLPESDNAPSPSVSRSSSDDAKGPRRRPLCALRGMDAGCLVELLSLGRLAGRGDGWNAGVWSRSAWVAASRKAVSSNSSPYSSLSCMAVAGRQQGSGGSGGRMRDGDASFSSACGEDGWGSADPCYHDALPPSPTCRVQPTCMLVLAVGPISVAGWGMAKS